jgi:hypothetical protein
MYSPLQAALLAQTPKKVYALRGNNTMEENVALVFRGFLNLTGKEKLKLIEEINVYFDSNEREPIREANEAKFGTIDLSSAKCKCCGR